MQRNIIYYSDNNNIEYIFYKNSTHSYPMHTHANHITIGHVTDGAVCIIQKNQECLYYENQSFCIMPDIPHAVKPIQDASYSMISVCIRADKIANESENEAGYVNLMSLKQAISEAPENAFLIEDMAQSIGISPYHMIRRFQSACGLTPHQFQIQCRVRRAQKLLEAGKNVVEVAYATGFCDQSHFDRCFRKIVRLTPSEYKQAASRLA